MDQRPHDSKEVIEVEYVEAEPIEPSEVFHAEQQQQPYVRTYYSNGGCFPCCGPFGCIFTLLFLSYIFYEFEFVRAVAFALAIFVVVSILAGSLTRRNR